MSNIKRFNLSFNIDEENARLVYERIMNQPGNTKTSFIIKAVLAFDNVSESYLNAEVIKRCLKEVLEEHQLVAAQKEIDPVSEMNIDNEIPTDIMDILAGM
jgi:hypothetical protein